MMDHMVIKPTRAYAEISAIRSPACVDCTYPAAAHSAVKRAHALIHNGALHNPLIARKQIHKQQQQQCLLLGCTVRLNVRCEDEGSLPNARELEPPRSLSDDLSHAALVGTLGELYELDGSPPDIEGDGHGDTHPDWHLKAGARWPQIQGAGDWEGMLDPIDPVLKAEIIRYGESAQATYDAFDFATRSKFCFSSKHSLPDKLDEVNLHSRGYGITDHLYATAGYHFPKIFRNSRRAHERWRKDSNWMGFVAVTTSPTEIARLGRRDMVVAWRGTVTKLEGIENLMPNVYKSHWWQEANKGLVKDARGRWPWVVRERDPDNFPEPEGP